MRASVQHVPLTRSRWLFSPQVDLSVFLGSAVLALLALAVGRGETDTPDWAWVPAVLLVDVAHVWSTGFRVYLDREAFSRRRGLYLAIPIICFAAAAAVYQLGADVFWRVLAYLAVFHFVRQQFGWVALYRKRNGETDRIGFYIDAAAVYAATLYPLLWWHTHLPRHFAWFMTGDFVSIPFALDRIVWPLYVGALGLYLLNALRRPGNLGKHVVVGTTALLWYVGIIGCNTDYAFTVTNVLPHGIPYFALIWFYGRRRRSHRVFDASPLCFLGTLWLIAYVEEMLWDRAVWHDRAWLFGAAWHAAPWHAVIVPLLALPQLVHYVLDGYVWRRSNPELVGS
ncbi:MAG: hypothetical protein ACYCW6_14910 [Candidatus Xenobia bacterium]